MRFFNGSHHYVSTNRAAAEAQGFKYEGVAFKFLANPETGAHAIYSCIIPGAGRFLSMQSDCDGKYQVEGLIGYLYVSGSKGVGVYRCYRPTPQDHLTTKDTTECSSSGYNIEGVIGYAPQ